MCLAKACPWSRNRQAAPNGLTRDLQGRLLACEHETRRVTARTRRQPPRDCQQLQGRRLNRPNDVVVKSDGCIYFTDPNHNVVPEQWDLQFPGVYRLTPDLGLSLVSDSLSRPTSSRSPR